MNHPNREISRFLKTALKTNKNLLDHLKAQISKDLALSGSHIEMQQIQNPEQLWEELMFHLTHLSHQNREVLKAFLYRVDIPDDEISDVLNKSDEILILNDITELVLRRELQKIKYRAGNL